MSNRILNAINNTTNCPSFSLTIFLILLVAIFKLVNTDRKLCTVVNSFALKYTVGDNLFNYHEMYYLI